MTAYLQPGDKIHITVPDTWGSREAGKRKLEKVVSVYEAMGITVVEATPVVYMEQVTVVSVIREAKAPAPPRSNLVPYPEIPKDLKAHWNPPWQDLDQPHPGYSDHPRVP